jgi:hypothetical protein
MVYIVTKLDHSRSHVDWCKFCINFIKLNIGYFGTVEATRLKLWHRAHLQWHELHAEFYGNLPFGSKDFSG